MCEREQAVCVLIVSLLQDMVDRDVPAVGVRMRPADPEHLPQVGTDAGDCELCGKIHPGVADPIPRRHDLPGNEGPQRVS